VAVKFESCLSTLVLVTLSVCEPVIRDPSKLPVLDLSIL
jgi:hypothetical protein